MKDLLNLFATAATELNQVVPAFENQGNVYQPGLGPYSEDEIVNLTINHLTERNLINDVHIGQMPISGSRLD